MAERDLFNSKPEPVDDAPKADRQAGQRQAPLAARMRPRTRFTHRSTRAPRMLVT